MKRITIISLMVLLVASSAIAGLPHGTNVFVTVESGKTVVGNAKSGNQPVVDGKVRVYAPDGSILLETETDNQGNFRFEAPCRCDMRIEVEHAGHLGKASLKADLLPADLHAFGEEPKEIAEASGEELKLNSQQIELAVEAAVAKKIVPLQQQIAEMQEDIGFQDILGGLGYILGIFGLVLYFKSKSN